MKNVLAVSLSLLVLGLGADGASAGCDFQHPQKARSLSSSLVQAYLSCYGANTTTEGGISACTPPQTFHQQAGWPNGWLWDERKATGKVSFKAAKNKVPAFLSQPNTADLAVQLSLSGVLTAGSLGPAGGNGTLVTLARATFEDRAGGGTTLTVVDFPLGFTFAMVAGRATLKTSVNARLNGIGQPGLPGCASLEVVAVNVVDPNGNAFANLGTFLPDLPQ